MWEFLYDWEVWSLWPPSTCIAIYLIRHFPKDWKWCYVVSAVNSGCWKKLAGKNVVYSLICWYLLQMARGCLNFLSSSILQSRLSCRKNSHGWLIYTEVRFCLTFLSIRLVCVGENVFADIDFCISGLTFLGLFLLTQPSSICLYSVYISLSDCGSLCGLYIISVHDSGLLMCSCFFSTSCFNFICNIFAFSVVWCNSAMS